MTNAYLKYREQRAAQQPTDAAPQNGLDQALQRLANCYIKQVQLPDGSRTIRVENIQRVDASGRIFRNHSELLNAREVFRLAELFEKAALWIGDTDSAEATSSEQPAATTEDDASRPF